MDYLADFEELILDELGEEFEDMTDFAFYLCCIFKNPSCLKDILFENDIFFSDLYESWKNGTLECTPIKITIKQGLI